MPTYLLTWNPKRSHRWGDNLEDDFVKRGQFYLGRWSCGKTKRIQPGDRVFLIRLGKEPRGIVASGWSESSPFEDKHSDEQLARAGKKSLNINVRLDNLLNAGGEEILSRKDLDKGVLGKAHWDTELSGINIPDDAAARLEARWAGAAQHATT